MYIGQLLPRALSDALSKWSGDSSAPEMEKAFGGTDLDLRLQAYVAEVGQLVAGGSPMVQPVTVLADTKVANAFAIGNGRRYITRALLLSLDDEAQLASVLGHETTHVTERHIGKSIEEQYGTIGLASLVRRLVSKKLSEEDKKSLSGILALGTSLVVNGFSREHEEEADMGGLDAMVRAGYDPFAMADVMRKFQAVEKPASGLEYYMRSHPLASERVSDIEARIASRYPSAGGERNAARFQEAVHGVPADAGAWEGAKPYAAAAGAAGGVLLAFWLAWRAAS